MNKLYVKKDSETNKILSYGYDPRNKNNNTNINSKTNIDTSSNSNTSSNVDENILDNEIILEITQEQWIQSKYGKLADIVDGFFIIKENTEPEVENKYNQFLENITPNYKAGIAKPTRGTWTVDEYGVIQFTVACCHPYTNQFYALINNVPVTFCHSSVHEGWVQFSILVPVKPNDIITYYNYVNRANFFPYCKTE